MPLSIPHCTLGARIASGRRGEVWSAVWEDGTPVAVKTVRRDHVGDVARFLREAQALAELRHPHVVACLASGQSDEHLWLILELATRSLAEEVVTGPLDAQQVLVAARDAALGLQALHEKGLIHRDVSPSNLLRMADGRVVVADFGLIQGGQDRLTATGEILGTPAYLAPEQADGGRVTQATDVYGLGATLYTLATGRAPYQADSAWSMLARISSGPFPDPRLLAPSIPPGLRAVIRAATAVNPTHRYDHTGLIAEDCVAILDGGTPKHAGALRTRFEAAYQSVAGAGSPKPKPSHVALIAVLVAAGLFGIGLGWWMGQPDPAERSAFAAAVADGTAAAWDAYIAAYPAGEGIAAARRARSIIEAPSDDPRLRELIERRIALEAQVRNLRSQGER